jgi:hypothetical protein
VRPRDWKSFFAGAALGIVAAKLLPVVKQAARPVARGLIAGAVDLGYKTRTMAAQAREEIDNMVAEARYEHDQRAQGPGLPLPEPGAGASQVSEQASDTRM